jgi:hypothetical protein
MDQRLIDTRDVELGNTLGKQSKISMETFPRRESTSDSIEEPRRRHRHRGCRIKKPQCSKNKGIIILLTIVIVVQIVEVAILMWGLFRAENEIIRYESILDKDQAEFDKITSNFNLPQLLKKIVYIVDIACKDLDCPS